MAGDEEPQEQHERPPYEGERFTIPAEVIAEKGAKEGDQITITVESIDPESGEGIGYCPPEGEEPGETHPEEGPEDKTAMERFDEEMKG